MKVTPDELNASIASAVSGPLTAAVEALGAKLSEDFDAKLAALQAPVETEKPVVSNVREAGEDDPRGGFRDWADLSLTVRRAKLTGQVDKRLLIVNKTAGHMEEGDDAQGGYLVPEEFKAELLRLQLERGVFAPRARVIPMGSNILRIPAINETTHVGSVYGGIIVKWPGEAGEKVATKPALGRVTLSLKKCAAMMYASDELMEDSAISLNALIPDLFGGALAFEQDNMIVSGVGGARPLGILVSPCLVTVPAEALQPADTIWSENILNMWARMHPMSHGNAVWFANSETFPQLATMTINVGTGGSPVWLPANGVAGSPNGTIMGRPLIFTEHCSALGDLGDIILADMSQYLLGQKAGGGVKFDTSSHLRFDYDETAFRFVQRYDGQPWWLSALAPKHGAGGGLDTLSPFVVLAARA